jgi:hypothetical protein
MLLAFCVSCESRISNSEKLVIEHFKLLNSHDLKNLAKQYSNKVTILSPGSPYLNICVYGLMRDYELYFTYCDATQFKIENIVATDSIVAVEYKIIGLPKKIGPALTTNFYPNGIELNNCSIFHIKDNKIISETIYSNKVLHD